MIRANRYHFISSHEEDLSHEERFPITASVGVSLLRVGHARIYIYTHTHMVCVSVYRDTHMYTCIPPFQG